MEQIIRNIALVSLVLLTSCSEDEEVNSLNQDFINIVSVNPSSELKDGEEYNFIIETEYNLITYDEGLVSVSFNINGLNSYRAILTAHSGVEKGNGNHTFDVLVNAKDWKNEGDFRVIVSLYESVLVDPNETPRDPERLASDNAVLTFGN